MNSIDVKFNYSRTIYFLFFIINYELLLDHAKETERIILGNTNREANKTYDFFSKLNLQI